MNAYQNYLNSIKNKPVGSSDLEFTLFLRNRLFSDQQISLITSIVPVKTFCSVFPAGQSIYLYDPEQIQIIVDENGRKYPKGKCLPIAGDGGGYDLVVRFESNTDSIGTMVYRGFYDSILVGSKRGFMTVLEEIFRKQITCSGMYDFFTSIP